MVKRIRHADLETNAGVVFIGHGANHFSVARQYPAAAVLPQIQQGDVFILPNSVLIQIERPPRSIRLDQRHIVDVKAPVRHLIGSRLTYAYVFIGRPTDEILTVDLALELDCRTAHHW